MAGANRHILVVDDDANVAASHKALLEGLGYTAHVECDPRRVEPALASLKELSLVLLDLRMPHIDGRELMRRLQTIRPDLGVIIATVINDIEEAVQAIKTGAYNYLLKPIHPDRLQEVLISYFSNRPGPLNGDDRFRSVPTKSPLFDPIFRRAVAFASQKVPVLLEGETGTGKELFARLLHSLGAEAAQPFLAFNVSAVSKGLFEAELFGHGRGAFTGAVSAKPGYCAAAGSGTLFLDEIGEVDLEEQKKLLRLIQERRFRPVGETQERDLEARLVFATNRDLKREIEKGNFREDLYYRLSAHTITLPPLRERKEDIEFLAAFFLHKYRSQYGRQVEEISPEAIRALTEYDFPGNVRELEGVISAAVLLEDSKQIQLAALPGHIRTPGIDDSIEGHAGLRIRDVMRVLNECNGNQTRAAEKLGMARETLNRLLRKNRERLRTEAAAEGRGPGMA